MTNNVLHRLAVSSMTQCGWLPAFQPEIWPCCHFQGGIDFYLLGVAPFVLARCVYDGANGMRIAAGKGSTPQQAILSAYSELVERECASVDFPLHSDTDLDETASLRRWSFARGHPLTESRSEESASFRRLLLDTPANGQPNHLSDSTGLAAHTDPASARCNSYLEIVERHAVWQQFFSTGPKPIVEYQHSSTYDSPLPWRIPGHLHVFCMEVEHLHVAHVIKVASGGSLPTVSSRGARAATTQSIAIDGAMLEALQLEIDVLGCHLMCTQLNTSMPRGIQQWLDRSVVENIVERLRPPPGYPTYRLRLPAVYGRSIGQYCGVDLVRGISPDFRGADERGWNPGNHKLRGMQYWQEGAPDDFVILT